MRFSLTTLVLIAFWLSALILVWVRREPWEYRDPKLRRPTLDECRKGHVSPDGSRSAGHVPNWHLVIRDIRDEHSTSYRSTLFETYLLTDPSPSAAFATFVDDNTIAVNWEDESGTYRAVFLSRRFPEWWWGHFYRPEVWLAFVLTGVLVWRGVRSRCGLR